MNIARTWTPSSVCLLALLALAGGSPSAAQRTYGPGVCGPADPSYIQTASETGGQPFFLSPTEVSASAKIMSASMQSELMLWTSGQGDRTFTLSVDPSVETATFAASFDGTGGTLTVVSPHDVEIKEDAGIEDTRLNCARVVAIRLPASGTWQLRVAPSSRFWLVARGKTDLAILGADFVEPGGRPGHEGLFKIKGQPIAGKPATLRVRLSSAAPSPTFHLVSADARILQTLELKAVGGHEFVGPVVPPDQPFRVEVQGVDRSGEGFQRVHGPLMHAAPGQDPKLP